MQTFALYFTLDYSSTPTPNPIKIAQSVTLESQLYFFYTKRGIQVIPVFLIEFLSHYWNKRQIFIKVNLMGTSRIIHESDMIQFCFIIELIIENTLNILIVLYCRDCR